MRRELRAAGDDTLRWQTANRLFDSYIGLANIDTAARYAGLMYNYADATGSREMKSSTTRDVSVLIARNNIEEAYELILPRYGRHHPADAGQPLYPADGGLRAARLGRRVGGAAEGPCRSCQAPPHTDRFRRPLRVTRQRMYALELMDSNRYDEALRSVAALRPREIQ